MSLEKYSIPFDVTDWSTVSSTSHPGETGVATWQTKELGGLRIRMVEYSKNYLADHWCQKGHLLFVLEGELITELSDGKKFQMTKGMSYQVSDVLSSHRSFAPDGAKLLIVDGSFLAV
ncbi:MAG: DHCW motif cupin fold protein [Bacteroidia bacterium]|nr:DHCW motif cupin fold protein [Bacteroidia bacterium]